MSHLLCFYLMSVFCGVTTRVIHLLHMIIWYSYDTTVKCSNYSKFHVFSNRFHVMIHLVSWCFMFLQWLSYEETAELSFAAQLKAQLGHRRCGLGALTGTAWVGTEMRGPQMLVHVYPIIHVYPCLSISIHVYPCLSISCKRLGCNLIIPVILNLPNLGPKMNRSNTKPWFPGRCFKGEWDY